MQIFYKDFYRKICIEDLNKYSKYQSKNIIFNSYFLKNESNAILIFLSWIESLSKD